MSARVLITGGASGLGLALAEQFLARGDEVLIGDLAAQRSEGLPERAAYVPLDVRSDAHWSAARDWVQEQWGGLDYLVNNAGIATGGRIDVESLADWERVLDVNLLGVVRGCRTFTPMLKAARSGHLINIASLAGLIHGPGMSSYNAAKAGVVALSETLGFELSPWGISVSVACPSFFRTNLHTSMVGADTEMEATAVALIEKAPYTAQDVAAAILAGVDAGQAVILPDEIAQVMTATKRNDPDAYGVWGRDGAARLAHKELSS